MASRAASLGTSNKAKSIRLCLLFIPKTHQSRAWRIWIKIKMKSSLKRHRSSRWTAKTKKRAPSVTVKIKASMRPTKTNRPSATTCSNLTSESRRWRRVSAVQRNRKSIEIRITMACPSRLPIIPTCLSKLLRAISPRSRRPSL